MIRIFIKDTKFASFLAQSYHKSVRRYSHVADKMSLPHDGCSRTVPLAFATVNTISCSYPLVSDRVDAAPGELLDEWRAATGSSGSKILEGEVYGPKGAHNARAIEGLPVGIQVVCQPWEERVLAIMHVVDAALGPDRKSVV